MRDATIARNYAATLLVLAQRAKDPHGWGLSLAEVANAVQSDERLRHFLESPRVSADQKNAVISTAFGGRTPRLFVRFLQTLVLKRRQMLIPEISLEYQTLVDDLEGRVHAAVTVAREPNKATRTALTKQISKAIGKEVVPHIVVNPAILGGVVVRVGDKVLDGSVRRRLTTLRSKMLASRA
ncbi:MAG: F0F1 ATP synthase subunit delta [Gemmatimonadaceae bacterium]